MSDKQTLRKELMARRAAVVNRRAMSIAAAERVKPLLHGNVMVYVSIGSEPCTHELITELMNKRDTVVYAPYTENGIISPRRLLRLGTPDKHGNLEEDCYCADDCRAEKLDFCVTPLLGFNRDGYRIGYGMGCFDRFFAGRDVFKIGLAFECLRIDFSADLHDVPLDCCVTEKNVIFF